MGILKKEEDLITYALYPEYRSEIPQRKDERRGPSGGGKGSMKRSLVVTL